MARQGSKHFSLQQLGEGVYAAFHNPGGWAIANAGFVDLGDTTLVYDSFLTPAAAQDLQRAAEEITGRPVTMVINSHHHVDHIWGNQVFRPQAEIVASVETRRLIGGRGMQEHAWYRQHAPAELARLRDDLQAEQDERRRRNIGEWIAYYEGIVESIPTLEVCLPNMVFEERLEIPGAKRSVELIAYRNAHTESDTALYIPSAKVLFMSDLLFVGCHPYLVDGDPAALSVVLGQVMELEAERYVPGHGPLGEARDLRLMEDYLQACREAAAELAQRGGGAHGSPPPEIPAPFHDWSFPAFFETNVRAMMRAG